MKSIIRLLRIKQWVKNLFLFVPTFFAGNIFNNTELKLLFAGAFAFSLVASGVYVINDYRDRHIDRLHPRKKLRPIASGEVKEGTARILMFLLITAGLTLSYFININSFYLVLGYFILHLGYSLGLKNIA